MYFLFFILRLKPGLQGITKKGVESIGGRGRLKKSKVPISAEDTVKAIMQIEKDKQHREDNLKDDYFVKAIMKSQRIGGYI